MYIDGGLSAANTLTLWALCVMAALFAAGASTSGPSSEGTESDGVSSAAAAVELEAELARMFDGLPDHLLQPQALAGLFSSTSHRPDRLSASQPVKGQRQSVQDAEGRDDSVYDVPPGVSGPRHDDLDDVNDAREPTAKHQLELARMQILYRYSLHSCMRMSVLPGVGITCIVTPRDTYHAVQVCAHPRERY